jgi:hypothetical protein
LLAILASCFVETGRRGLSSGRHDPKTDEAHEGFRSAAQQMSRSRGRKICCRCGAISHRYTLILRRRLEMAAQSKSLLPVGRVLEISFATFTPRITICSDRELTVEIIAGDNIGFSDTVTYEAVAVRDGLVVLSWQEHIGSTIVHVLDVTSHHAYTVVTSANGEFMRLTGRIKVKSGT